MKYPWPGMSKEDSAAKTGSSTSQIGDSAAPGLGVNADMSGGQSSVGGVLAQNVCVGKTTTVAKPLDGVALAKTIKTDLAARVARLRAAGFRPGLATVLVGEDPASQVYVGMKHRDCQEIGLESLDVRLPATTSEAEVLAAVDQLNENQNCTGMIVQLPLPRGIDQQKVLERIDPAKDADGLHPYNLGLLVSSIDQEPQTPQPCTPRGIIELLAANRIDLAGKQVVVVGRGLTVGRPIGLLLTRKNVNTTCTLCHTGTKNLAEHLAKADVVIAAAGVPGMIRAEQLKPGVVVVDVGVSRVEGKIVGDVAPGVEHVAAWLTPNPGGVGPMTRAMLLANVIDTAERLVGGD